ncbi:MAG: hypothetical protein QGG58_03470 [Chloroflexota bacterium]|nr:hypothetical protein [Chloroflexota bacterium]
MAERPPEENREDPFDLEIEPIDAEVVDLDDAPIAAEPDDPAQFAPGGEPEAAPPPPPLPRVQYAEIPDPFGEGILVAHDRQALVAAIAAGDPRRGIQAADDLVWSPESRVRDIEEAAVAQLRGRRVRRGARCIFWRVVAVALPLLVAALLGDLGLLLRLIPVVGPPVGEFVGSAGASLGGLPLGFAIAILPSIWLWRRKSSDPDDYWPKLPRRLPRNFEFVPIERDLAGFTADVESTIQESRELARGRQSVAGADAVRLEEVVHRAYRQARRAGIDVAAAVYLDLRRRLHAAARPPPKRLGFLTGRRNAAELADLLAPYRPTNARASSGLVGGAFRVLAGLVAALATFFLAGLFRIGPTDFEVIRPNTAWAFPGSLDHLDAGGLSWMAVDGVDEASAIPVYGPGWFWAWPVPLTRREHVPTTDHKVSVQALLGARDESGFDTLKIDFSYQIEDVRVWVSRGSNARAEDVVADTIAQNLADFIEVQRRDIQSRRSGVATEILKDNMTDILERYAGGINSDAEIRALGIRIETVTDFGFAVFRP